jgi:hypothetical protein
MKSWLIFFKIKTAHSVVSQILVVCDLLRVAYEEDTVGLQGIVEILVDHRLCLIRKIDNNISA